MISFYIEYCFVTDAISERISKVEELLLQYEDACERVELGRKKYEEELELSTLVEKRQ